MTRLSFAVQAHPRRSLLAKHLADSIGADIVWDPDPDGPPSPWRTFRLLLESTPAWATHRLQIQDDAHPCRGFRQAVELAAAARPDRLLVLYVGGNPYAHSDAVRQACREGRCFAALDPAQWTPCVATVWPVALIEGLGAWYDAQRFPATFVGDDEIVGRYLRHIGHRALACSPSLVHHDDMQPSMVGQRTRYGDDLGRVTTLFVDNCGCDPTAFDWENGRHDRQEAAEAL